MHLFDLNQAQLDNWLDQLSTEYRGQQVSGIDLDLFDGIEIRIVRPAQELKAVGRLNRLNICVDDHDLVTAFEVG